MYSLVNNLDNKVIANLNIDNILTIMWQEVGPSKEWIPVRRWSFDSFAEPTAFGYNLIYKIFHLYY